ncbi:type 2 isopentenyl-diphosphate Delta-isomerase [Deinococcus maricopensis]|uniref:Isopentenyl-diphosphate delta-isomerase n=1 Tax=Deinococcus maricopensis (strain DSM 21211 / LMG 22137 / NRRL B-23946 / LB-34) TaxID=709986 RepID=E8U691_DEIML|nr:type 2 isopentenyl-diphosphate Delta-isomerase [Deinococcus maricopensis]ADV66580.1 Isopentenyl-diphosphate delta-isomerase [Deinococcus maricopensis DSM 21211]
MSDGAPNVDLSDRKLRHIEACLRADSQYAHVTTGFERLRWPYRALPDLNVDDVDLRTTFLGRALRAPVLIGAMTGGAQRAAHINRNLATAAQRLGVGLMLGSQRVMLERPDTAASFQVRAVAPDVLLIGNLGAAQFLRGYDEAHVVRAVEGVGADALAIHVNPLQEALQAGGDRAWAGVAARLAEVVPRVPYPLLLKEVGHGLDGAAVRAAARAGFAALDVAGAGGTSWARVEQLVRFGAVRTPDLCEVGVPTAQALLGARAAAPGVPLIASGGIRSGLDAAKALALGATAVAVARPLLAPALDSAEAVEAWLATFLEELRVALFVGGFGSVRAVQGALGAEPLP